MSAPPSEAARRKNVQDAIDRVLFKVCHAAVGNALLLHTAGRRLSPHGIAPKLPPAARGALCRSTLPPTLSPSACPDTWHRSTSWRLSWATSPGRTSCCTPSCEAAAAFLCYAGSSQGGRTGWAGMTLCVTAGKPPCAAAAHTHKRWSLQKPAVLLATLPACSNEYVAELGKLEAAKDDMIGGGQPVELAVELLRCVRLLCFVACPQRYVPELPLVGSRWSRR